ncbi:hypothetical protein [Quatrionicoccus australiensis]|uniref:hypothetical protein n=1 Tax=Quatrionicoccus australiensis TaxID=138118 RepID=UPI001CF872BC|nr:hypothetical protein [Quatrionicoccus australiensis]UCV13650.1 hypothetical protein KI612_11840 [Quatrionicoccus australiensis]
MFDRAALNAALVEGAGLDLAALAESHPSLFSQAAVAIAPATRQAMADIVAAIESVVALPAWQQRVLAGAPALAQRSTPARSVFFGYDFHLAVDGPKLIEINTNAGGALLNTCLLRAHGETAAAERIEQEIVAMFRAEWQLERGDAPLTRIAIVDENPAAQYLAPEFELFRRLFARNGIAAVIADPAELLRDGERLLYRGEVVDLVYNRLTDFALEAAVNADLQAVFAAGGVVVTPHPRAHALYADKRNLMLLSDPVALSELGVPAATQEILLAGIPRTVAVTAEQGEQFWSARKNWFFKPAAGFGSRATYRGDKLTKRVFEEILQGGYIAQEIVPPSTQTLLVDAVAQDMKLDVRCYTYAARIQLVAARLYQGQTTNFRTPGGGFAPVFAA